MSENLLTKRESNNHQRTFAMTNSANVPEHNSNRYSIQQSNQFYSPSSQSTLRRNSMIVPQSNYEKLNSTLNYMDQYNQSKLFVSDANKSSYSNKVLSHVQPQQLNQHDYLVRNGTYMTRGSNYEVAYSGGATQMPITSKTGIYDAYQVQEPPYVIYRDGSFTYATQPIMNRWSETRWKDPDLEEVISFLSSPDPVIRANSVAYLQHLSYADDHIKQRIRLLGGVPMLVELLNRDMLEVQRNVCGALRNLSYGRKNDINKRAIRDAMGIQALARALNNPDNEIRELATSVLWNLSSCEDIKWAIIDEALASIVSVIIEPYTTWFKANMNCSQQYITSNNDTHWSTVFRNATGIIRNISSAGASARKQLRNCDGLIESFLFILNVFINRNDVENKLVENCVCALRNLSYRCQETQDPDYDKHYYTNSACQPDSGMNSMQNSPPSPSSITNLTASPTGQISSKDSENLGCFSFGRRSKSKLKAKSTLSTSRRSSNSNQAERFGTIKSENRSLLPPHHSSKVQTRPSIHTLFKNSTQLDDFSDPNVTTSPRSGVASIASLSFMGPSGKELLWQPDVVKLYLALLSRSSNSETLEAAAGAIQNLAACYWQPSIDIRAAVRNEGGLPLLVELLRVDKDRVVCAVATALRNLAIDQKNKELIWKYAMPDLVNKLSGQTDQNSHISDDTVAAALATLHEVISNNSDLARSLYESGRLNKLNSIVRNGPKYSSQVQRIAAQDTEMERKIGLELRIRELAAQSMLEAQNEIDILEVEKSLLTSYQRMSCYAKELEQQRKKLSNPSLSTDGGRVERSPQAKDKDGDDKVQNCNNTTASPTKSAKTADTTDNSGSISRGTGFRARNIYASRYSAGRSRNKRRDATLQSNLRLGNMNSNTSGDNRASVQVSEIRIPLMWRDIDHFKGRGDYKLFAVFCLLKINSQIYDTQLVSDVDKQVTDITFEDQVVFNEVEQDFELELEVYSCVYLEQFSLSSTPRKLKEKLTSSVGRAMGRWLMTQTVSSNFTKELQAYDKSYRFSLIANAKLKLQDASDSVKTYDLTPTSRETDKNNLPLFGNFCCKLYVKPVALE